MKKYLSEKSKPLVESVLKTTDLYHFTEYPWEASLQDVAGNSFDIVRSTYIMGKEGLINATTRYKDTFSRMMEFATAGDHAHSLRQKINIVNEMVECNFESNLPVHISIAPLTSEQRKINLLDLDNHKNFRFIVHPGQTRCQASVFCKTPLKNVLLYIKKEYKEQCQLELTPHCTKIETEEQLLNIYRPDSSTTEDVMYDFWLPGQGDGLKKHRPNKTPILKCNQIFDEAENSYHNSNFYTERSFMSMRNFIEILLNNTFNIYTPKGQYYKMSSIQIKNRNDLQFGINKFNLYFGIDEHRESDWGQTLSEGFHLRNGYNPLQDLPKTEYKLYETFSNFFDQFNENWEYYKNTQQERAEKTRKIFNVDLREVESSCTLKQIVETNNFKGFCVFVDIEKIEVFKRDLTELLFLINSNVCVSHNKDNTLAVLNCEHEYWKTGKNYNTWNIEESFYS